MFRKAAALSLAVLMGVAAPLATAAPALADGQTMDRAAVEAIVKDYLLKNPEVIRDALIELDRRQRQAAADAHAAMIKTLKPVLLNSENQVTLGNPKGDVTVVEFFDYNCPYCRQAMPEMLDMLKADPNLRFVLKEWPVLGPESVEAARVAAAVNLVAPDKYIAFHTKLLSSQGRVNGAKALEVAASVGIDKNAVSDHLKDKRVDAALAEVSQLARTLGLDGTPSYVVGDEVVYGAVGSDQLTQMVGSIRKCGKATC